MSQDDLEQVKEKAAIPIGAVGMEFIKMFGGDYYNGKVVRIYSLDQLKKFLLGIVLLSTIKSMW